MCYSAAQKAKWAYYDAVDEGKPKWLLNELLRNWENAQLDKDEDSRKKWRTSLAEPRYYVNGFEHAKLLVLKNEDEFVIEKELNWGLIPHWAKDKKTAFTIWNKTLNARGESIFEKPSFRDAAKSNRGLIFLDGFYEYHHHNGQSYPFFIKSKITHLPIVLGVIYSDWVDKETGEIIESFSIVTRKGNSLLSKIHNNPKLDEPRMPLVLTPDSAQKWLKGTIEDAKNVIEQNPKVQLTAYSVGKLVGKNSIGDAPEATEEVQYPSLKKLYEDIEV